MSTQSYDESTLRLQATSPARTRSFRVRRALGSGPAEREKVSVHVFLITCQNLDSRTRHKNKFLCRPSDLESQHLLSHSCRVRGHVEILILTVWTVLGVFPSFLSLFFVQSL